MKIMLLFVCLIAGTLHAAGNPAVGKWNCSSLGENGMHLTWSLAVTEQDGKLAATVTLDTTDIPLIEPKLEGKTLTFKLRVNDHEVVSFELKIDGDKLAGRFEGVETGKAAVTGARAN